MKNNPQKCRFSNLKSITAKVFLMFAVFNYSQQLFAQFTDDFSDGDFVSDPRWSGHDSKFIIESTKLSLKAPPATDNAYLGCDVPCHQGGIRADSTALVSVSPISPGSSTGRGRVFALEASLAPRAGGLAGKRDRDLLALSRLCAPNGRAPLYCCIELRLYYGIVCRHCTVDSSSIRPACVGGDWNCHGRTLAAGEAQRIGESWRRLDTWLCGLVCRAHRLFGTVYP